VGGGRARNNDQTSRLRQPGGIAQELLGIARASHDDRAKSGEARILGSITDHADPCESELANDR